MRKRYSEQIDEAEIEDEDLEPTDRVERNDDPNEDMEDGLSEHDDDPETRDVGYVCGAKQMPSNRGSDLHYLGRRSTYIRDYERGR
jgi:hypothetical protein